MCAKGVVENSTAVLSVGRLAEATGISADTLRVWERRYGKPKPLRLPSGHRRYPKSIVPWLRKVAEALARGSRPSQLLPLDGPALDAFLARDKPAAPSEEVNQWLSLTMDLRLHELERGFMAAANRESLIDFLDNFLTPFQIEVGTLWTEGKMDVHHEHLATDVIMGVLYRLRSRLDSHSLGPARGTILLANLPGEQHGAGLQMAATLCAECGVSPRMLGANTPIDEIALCATELKPSAVAIGVSLAQAGVGADRLLSELRSSLRSSLPLLVGGSGSRSGRRGPRGVRVLETLAEFRDWIEGERLGTWHQPPKELPHANI